MFWSRTGRMPIALDRIVLEAASYQFPSRRDDAPSSDVNDPYQCLPAAIPGGNDPRLQGRPVHQLTTSSNHTKPLRRPRQPTCTTPYRWNTIERKRELFSRQDEIILDPELVNFEHALPKLSHSWRGQAWNPQRNCVGT